jgi:hypothetical protein
MKTSKLYLRTGILNTKDILTVQGFPWISFFWFAAYVALVLAYDVFDIDVYAHAYRDRLGPFIHIFNMMGIYQYVWYGLAVSRFFGVIIFGLCFPIMERLLGHMFLFFLLFLDYFLVAHTVGRAAKNPRLSRPLCCGCTGMVFFGAAAITLWAYMCKGWFVALPLLIVYGWQIGFGTAAIVKTVSNEDKKGGFDWHTTLSLLGCVCMGVILYLWDPYEIKRVDAKAYSRFQIYVWTFFVLAIIFQFVEYGVQDGYTNQTIGDKPNGVCEPCYSLDSSKKVVYQ